MAGLETIALAVAHLESIDTGNDEQQPPITVSSASGRTNERGGELPYPKLHGRMVSDDSIYEANPSRGLAASLGGPPTSELSGRQNHGQFQQWPTNPAGPGNVRKPNAKQPPVAASGITTGPSQGAYQDTESKAQASGPAGILLEKLSTVTDDLDEFFTLINELEELALPDRFDGVKQKPADIPKPDESIFQVQRYDVLLGRGGETNHHVGNIQYRQLVKACQPAYLAAKRRDKPRIAVAIVRLVRAHSGRFLKKLPHDNAWADVGNIRAREKTSQALREGAPELRGTVESSRSQLLIEAVESSVDRKWPLDGCSAEFPFDPRQMHLPNMHVVPTGNDAHSELNPRNPTDHNRNASTQAANEMSNAVSRPLIIPPKGLTHYPMHHHVPMPMVPGPIFYHHPHGHVVYHPPNVGMDARYHHVYPDKRAMIVPSSSEPPKKRQHVTPHTTAASQEQAEDPVTSSLQTSLPSPKAGMPVKSTNATLVSADNSEEEPVPVRSASPASSTSSSKNACRGPRLKLLKQRFEDQTEV